jgi:hypothetical protein
MRTRLNVTLCVHCMSYLHNKLRGKMIVLKSGNVITPKKRTCRFYFKFGKYEHTYELEKRNDCAHLSALLGEF